MEFRSDIQGGGRKGSLSDIQGGGRKVRFAVWFKTAVVLLLPVIVTVVVRFSDIQGG